MTSAVVLLAQRSWVPVDGDQVRLALEDQELGGRLAHVDHGQAGGEQVQGGGAGTAVEEIRLTRGRQLARHGVEPGRHDLGAGPGARQGLGRHPTVQEVQVIGPAGLAGEDHRSGVDDPQELGIRDRLPDRGPLDGDQDRRALAHDDPRRGVLDRDAGGRRHAGGRQGGLQAVQGDDPDRLPELLCHRRWPGPASAGRVGNSALTILRSSRTTWRCTRSTWVWALAQTTPKASSPWPAGFRATATRKLQLVAAPALDLGLVDRQGLVTDLDLPGPGVGGQVRSGDSRGRRLGLSGGWGCARRRRGRGRTLGPRGDLKRLPHLDLRRAQVVLLFQRPERHAKTLGDRPQVVAGGDPIGARGWIVAALGVMAGPVVRRLDGGNEGQADRQD